MDDANVSIEDLQMQQAIELCYKSLQTGATGPPRAVVNSLDEKKVQAPEGGSSQGSQRPQTPPTPTPAKRRDIDDCINDIMKGNIIEMGHLNSYNADTLIFFNVPTRESGQTEAAYQRAKEHYQKPHRMSSQTLKALGSRKINRLLSAAYQTPQLQLGTLWKHGMNLMPANMKFVIDLTPPAEGEEALITLMDMCCPPGVCMWARSINRWDISSALVGGADDFTDFRLLPDQRSNVKPGKTFADNPEGTKLAFLAHSQEIDKLYPLPPYYSMIRHLTSIERVLIAIDGQDPRLNSAPKVYSTAMAAKLLGIVNHNITDYVVSWLRAEPNTCFVEAFPEVTIEIAEALKCEPICRDAFALLVGEASLDHVASIRDPIGLREGCSIHGRKREELHESWNSRLQYARDSFIDRVISGFHRLVDGNMDWIEEQAELQRILTQPVQPGHVAEKSRAQLVSLLKDYVRGAIYRLLCGTYKFMEFAVKDNRKGGADLYPRTDMKATWDSLRPKERLFTRCFWESLGSFRFAFVSEISWTSNLNVSVEKMTLSEEVGTSALEMDLMLASTYKMITMEKLKLYIALYNLTSKDVALSMRRFATPTADMIENFYAQDSNDETEPENPNKKRRSLGSNGATAVLPVRTAPPLPQNHPDPYPDTTNPLESDSSRDSSSTHPSQNPDSSSQLNIQWVELREQRMISESPQPPAPNCETLNLKRDLEQAQASSSADPNNVFSNEGTPQSTTGNLQARLGFTSTEMSSFLYQWSPPYHNSELGAGLFNLEEFLLQARLYLHEFAQQMLSGPQGGQIGDSIDVYLTNTLLCIGSEETKYLPLWAGGFDDATGGVFGSEIPSTPYGFGGPGPKPRFKFKEAARRDPGAGAIATPWDGYRPGNDGTDSNSSAASYTSARSSADLCELDEGDKSTFGTSTVVNDGYSDADAGVHRNAVVALDEVDAESNQWEEVRAFSDAKNQDRWKGKGKEKVPAAPPSDADISDDYEAITPTGDEKPTNGGAAGAEKGLDAVKLAKTLERKGLASAAAAVLEQYHFSALTENDDSNDRDDDGPTEFDDAVDFVYSDDDEDEDEDQDEGDVEDQSNQSQLEEELSYAGFDSDEKETASLGDNGFVVAAPNGHEGKKGAGTIAGDAVATVAKASCSHESENEKREKGNEVVQKGVGIGDEIRSRDAHTWIIYKEGPEDDDLMTRL